eukprot:3515442-Rhodomonas_salina.1
MDEHEPRVALDLAVVPKVRVCRWGRQQLRAVRARLLPAVPLEPFLALKKTRRRSLAVNPRSRRDPIRAAPWRRSTRRLEVSVIAMPVVLVAAVIAAIPERMRRQTRVGRIAELGAAQAQPRCCWVESGIAPKVAV